MWTVPATRTKTKREDRVPLTRRAEQVLDAARTLSNENALVFPSPRGMRFNDRRGGGLRLARRHPLTTMLCASCRHSNGR